MGCTFTSAGATRSLAAKTRCWSSSALVDWPAISAVDRREKARTSCAAVPRLTDLMLRVTFPRLLKFCQWGVARSPISIVAKRQRVFQRAGGRFANLIGLTVTSGGD